MQPTLTPEEFERQRLIKESNDDLSLSQVEVNAVEPEIIQNATPNDLKAYGIAALPLLLLVVGNQIKKIIQPSLNKITEEYGEKFSKDQICPTSQEIAAIKTQRDRIVEQLNKIGKTLNLITTALTGVSTFLNLITVTIKGIDTAKIIAQIAALTNPVAAAALPTILNTLNTAKTQVIIDSDGQSKIKKYKAIIGGASLVASLISGYILKAIETLNQLDFLLNSCGAQDLTPINSEITDIANKQRQAQETQNETTYNGFIIEIEVVPYTPTVNRRRAIGKNQYGIIMITTELSFTTDDQTLINELKLIIDRDNLKAY